MSNIAGEYEASRSQPDSLLEPPSSLLGSEEAAEVSEGYGDAHQIDVIVKRTWQAFERGQDRYSETRTLTKRQFDLLEERTEPQKLRVEYDSSRKLVSITRLSPARCCMKSELSYLIHRKIDDAVQAPEFAFMANELTLGVGNVKLGAIDGLGMETEFILDLGIRFDAETEPRVVFEIACSQLVEDVNRKACDYLEFLSGRIRIAVCIKVKVETSRAAFSVWQWDPEASKAIRLVDNEIIRDDGPALEIRASAFTHLNTPSNPVFVSLSGSELNACLRKSMRTHATYQAG